MQPPQFEFNVSPCRVDSDRTTELMELKLNSGAKGTSIGDRHEIRELTFLDHSFRGYAEDLVDTVAHFTKGTENASDNSARNESSGGLFEASIVVRSKIRVTLSGLCYIFRAGLFGFFLDTSFRFRVVDSRVGTDPDAFDVEYRLRSTGTVAIIDCAGHWEVMNQDIRCNSIT